MHDIIINHLQFGDISDAISIQIEGFIDTKTILDFRDVVDSLLNKGFTRILLDFENVKYVSSRGFSYLVFINEKLKDKKGLLVISKIQKEVAQMFQTLKLTDYFQFAENDNEAAQLLITTYK